MKNPPAMKETPSGFLGWEDPLEEGMVTHSSNLPGESPWTEQHGQAIVQGVTKSQTWLKEETQHRTCWEMSLHSPPLEDCQCILNTKVYIKSFTRKTCLILFNSVSEIYLETSSHFFLVGNFYILWGKNLENSMETLHKICFLLGLGTRCKCPLIP